MEHIPLHQVRTRRTDYNAKENVRSILSTLFKLLIGEETAPDVYSVRHPQAKEILQHRPNMMIPKTHLRTRHCTVQYNKEGKVIFFLGDKE